MGAIEKVVARDEAVLKNVEPTDSELDLVDNALNNVGLFETFELARDGPAFLKNCGSTFVGF